MNPNRNNRLISHVLGEKEDGSKFNVPLKKRKHEIKRKYEKKPTKFGLSRGRWVQWERVRFLQGLKIHGRGKWKQIAQMIPTRSTVQVKTHAQIILKQMAAGKDIFELLEEEPCLLREEVQGKNEVNRPTIVTGSFHSITPAEGKTDDDSSYNTNDWAFSNQSTRITESSKKQQYIMSPRKIMVAIHASTPPSELSSQITISSSPPRLLKWHNHNSPYQESKETEMEKIPDSSPPSIESMSIDTILNAACILVKLSTSPACEL